ncbi:Maf family protein [Rothia sp. AR01]|uniref:Nucleoside triphosphate pyrophosphatase n=1 Tax=Rothia santali TaxID=2949643 RepID=A0A9X2HKZ2_9MICC|nr:nucleoside triphosphate pyrophosphatase [Rothia santali]MCP3426843.1 Maf family protein [Rothia santali]
MSLPPDARPTPAPLLILASQSPSRVSILTASGIAFDQLVSGVDEDAALAAAEERAGGPLDPAATALELARVKAEAVAALPEARGRLVLGCDSVFELDGAAYGKPLEPAVARERIAGMSGRTGTLHTGHWLVDRRDARDPGAGTDPMTRTGPGPGTASKTGTASETGTDQEARPAPAPAPGLGVCRSADVTFARMRPEEIEAYVATGEPLWVAGSFTIEGYGAAFIEGIRGESHTVLGLSVNALRELLDRIDLPVTDLWTRA